MILIVEDDIAIQETLKELLCMKGYQVQQAYHMKEALLLDKSHIDVMIIDIQLPDGNGITLCQQMRQQSQIPILFLTAKDDEQTIVEALNAGGDDYITKPFRANELLAVSYTHLDVYKRQTPLFGYINNGGSFYYDEANKKKIYEKAS